jgi:hypothetical protein
MVWLWVRSGRDRVFLKEQKIEDTGFSMSHKKKSTETPDPTGKRTVSQEIEEQGSLSGRLLVIGKSAAPLWREPWRSTAHGEILYGEDGLPR